MHPTFGTGSRKKAAYAVIGIGFVLLILANALAWLYLQQVRGFFVSDLAFRLENIAQISSRLIDAADLGYILPEDPADPNVLYYQQLLSEIRDNNNLQDIYILSPAREILVDLPGDFSGAFTRHDVDEDLLRAAQEGNVVTSPLQSLGDHKFMSALAPVTDAGNLVAGILVVEAPANFFDVLERFNNGLMLFSALTFAVIVIAAYMLWRAFRRLIMIREQMHAQEHLVKLGEMAASVAHEIRNPLSIIKGASDLIEKKYGTPEDEFFKYIPAELQRLNKLIADFLSFARIREPQPEAVDLAELVQKIRIGFEDAASISYETEISGAVKNLKTDPGMLEQILLNVITNSRQAVAGNGRIKISASLKKKHVHITVDDNGTGIANENRARIFEPFFSTKDSGSGLGLAISKRLAEQLKGTLRVDSGPGGGTTVTLILPLNGA